MLTLVVPSSPLIILLGMGKSKTLNSLSFGQTDLFVKKNHFVLVAFFVTTLAFQCLCKLFCMLMANESFTVTCQKLLNRNLNLR